MNVSVWSTGVVRFNQDPRLPELRTAMQTAKAKYASAEQELAAFERLEKQPDAAAVDAALKTISVHAADRGDTIGAIAALRMTSGGRD